MVFSLYLTVSNQYSFRYLVVLTHFLTQGRSHQLNKHFYPNGPSYYVRTHSNVQGLTRHSKTRKVGVQSFIEVIEHMSHAQKSGYCDDVSSSSGQ